MSNEFGSSHTDGIDLAKTFQNDDLSRRRPVCPKHQKAPMRPGEQCADCAKLSGK